MESKELKKLTNDLSILYVEDDKDLSKKTLAILDNFFYESLVAYDGEEGLSVYKEYLEKNKKPIDIIISDIQMPNKNGIDLAKDIFAVNSKQIIIILSAYDDSHYLIELLNSGVAKFISKPFSQKELLSVLYTCCVDLKDIVVQEEFALGDGFIWDKKKSVLYDNSESVKLTKNEIIVLNMFTDHPNQIFSEEMIFNTIYFDNVDKEMSLDSIKSTIKRLRKKLPPKCIENIYGNGYRIHLMEDSIN